MIVSGQEGNECMKDKIREIKEIGLLADHLDVAPGVKSRLDACNPSDPLTLFIPNNDAVMKGVSRLRPAEVGSVGDLKKQQKEFLGALAAYHITTGNTSTSDLMNSGVCILNTTMTRFAELREGVSQKLLVVAGEGMNKTAEVLFSLQQNKRYWNGTSKIVLDEKYKGPNDAIIVRKDIKCKDGYIHVIDKVLLLPENVTQQLHASNLTGFSLLIKKADAGQWINNLTDATIFAPSNEALCQLDARIANKSIAMFGAKYQSFYRTKNVILAEGEEELTKRYKNLLELPREKLMNLIKAHVFKGVKYSTQFKQNSSITNYNGTQCTFQNLNQTKQEKIKSFRSLLSRFFSHHEDQSTNIANAIANIPISFANIFTQNGVIHVIDGVLGTNIAVKAKRENPIETPPIIIPAPKTTAPTVQTQGVGVACLNATLLENLSNITAKSNMTINNPEGPFKIIVSKEAPECPSNEKLCMVATLSNTCSVPSSPFKEETHHLIPAKPSEVNVAYANSITFTPRCYNPESHICINKHFLCPTSHPSLCGDACYNPTQYRCFAKFSMCPSHAQNLCGDACYDDKEYQCREGILKKKGKNGQEGQK